MEEYEMIKRKDAPAFNAIFAETDKNALEQITAGFDYVTRLIIEQCDRDIEVNRALGDQQAVIREQIKRQTIIHARGILNTCHLYATRQEVFDEYTQ
jgi:hypothetical protein